MVAGTEPKGFLEVPVRRPSTNACAKKEDSYVPMPSFLVACLVLLGPEFSLGQIETLPLTRSVRNLLTVCSSIFFVLISDCACKYPCAAANTMQRPQEPRLVYFDLNQGSSVPS